MRNNILLSAFALVSSSLFAQHAEMQYVASTAQLTLDNVGKKGVVTLTVTNPNATEYKDAPVCVKLPADLKYKSATVKVEGTEIPSQLDDLNGDGTFDELALVLDLAGQVSVAAL